MINDTVKFKDVSKFYIKVIIYIIFFYVVRKISNSYILQNQNVNISFGTFKYMCMDICYILYYASVIGKIIILGLAIINTVVIVLIKTINIFKIKK